MDTTCVAGEGDDEGGGGGGDIFSVSEMIEDGCESQVNLLEYYVLGAKWCRTCKILTGTKAKARCKCWLSKPNSTKSDS